MYETIERAKNTDGNAVLAQMFVYASTEILEYPHTGDHMYETTQGAKNTDGNAVLAKCFF